MVVGSKRRAVCGMNCLSESCSSRVVTGIVLDRESGAFHASDHKFLAEVRVTYMLRVCGRCGLLWIDELHDDPNVDSPIHVFPGSLDVTSRHDRLKSLLASMEHHL